MAHDDNYCRRRLTVCLSRQDWRSFADALVEVFPNGRYYYQPMVLFALFRIPPPIFHGEHMFRIGDLDSERLPEAEMHFDPDWKIEWSRPDPGDREATSSGKSDWSLRQPRLPTFRFEFGHHAVAEQGHPECLTSGQLWFFFAEADREHRAIGHKLFRLFRQFASNREQIVVRGLERDANRIYRKISPFWLGRDAIAWARQGETRLLNYRKFADPQRCWGIRPAGISA